MVCINERREVCGVLNNVYANVEGSDNQQDPICDSDGCADIVGDFSNHPRVRYIKRVFVKFCKS